jgi:hypothetical protein
MSTDLSIVLGKGSEGDAYFLNCRGTRGILEVTENLASRAAKGLRMWKEGKVLDAEEGIVASDSEKGVVYIFDPIKGKMMRAYEIVAPNGQKAYRKTGFASLGYLDGRNNEVRYDSHDFARLFAQGWVVVIPRTEKSQEAIVENVKFAQADDAGRRLILSAYEARRAEFAADSNTGRHERCVNKFFAWNAKHAGCKKLEELWAGKAWPIRVMFERNGSRRVRSASSPAAARANWTWAAYHGWEPVRLEESKW